MNKSREVGLFFIFWFCILLSPFLLADGKVKTQSLRIGELAPALHGRQTDDSIYSLSRSLLKPKVLNFFWVECLPCKKEIPLLSEKEQTYPMVEFVVVHTESNPLTKTNYNLADIRSFIEGLSAAPDRVVLGSPRLKTLFGLQGFPTTVLLSKGNRVEDVLVGFTAANTVRLETWLQRQ